MREDTIIVTDFARPRANYPHARRAGAFLFVSGLSSRRADDTLAGVTRTPDGQVIRDIAEQTEAVIENLRTVLRAAGADLDHLVDVTVFLVNMADYAAFNAVYDRYFSATTGPTRTTVAVRELPHPDLLIEIKAVALVDSTPD
ncbi:MAG: RidA family protein [Chloracidobacterium sp.]|uniref:RidA family protein n=1 Tax=Chloracidobacterium validum TaxID=2821543 RepID=A0ABX8B793_9BACT|nr:RidA family protein [Chloracidobacterium validum]QUW02521.1 RidA family protein [Chloracidobacterium validum]